MNGNKGNHKLLKHARLEQRLGYVPYIAMTTEQLNHQTAFKMHLVADGGVQPSCACTVDILLTVLHVYTHVLMDSKQ